MVFDPSRALHGTEGGGDVVFYQFRNVNSDEKPGHVVFVLLMKAFMSNDIINPALLETKEYCYCKANWVRFCMSSLSTSS
jgi:hypothetical protein